MLMNFCYRMDADEASKLTAPFKNVSANIFAGQSELIKNL